VLPDHATVADLTEVNSRTTRDNLVFRVSVASLN